jgi:hypothetical protein
MAAPSHTVEANSKKEAYHLKRQMWSIYVPDVLGIDQYTKLT